MAVLNGIYDIGGLYLIDSSAYSAHLMDVVLILVASFIFCLTDEAVPYDEPQLYEQLHGVVERGPGYTEISCLQDLAELFQREMTSYAINRIEDGIALGSLPVSVVIKVIVQNVPNFFLYSVVCHCFTDLEKQDAEVLTICNFIAS